MKATRFHFYAVCLFAVLAWLAAWLVAWPAAIMPMIFAIRSALQEAKYKDQ